MNPTPTQEFFREHNNDKQVSNLNNNKEEDIKEEEKSKIQKNYIDSSFKSKTCFVGGLIDGITEEDLHKYFMHFGEIAEIKIPKSSQFSSKIKGYALIQFKTKNGCEKALKQKEHKIPLKEIRYLNKNSLDDQQNQEKISNTEIISNSLDDQENQEKILNSLDDQKNQERVSDTLLNNIYKNDQIKSEREHDGNSQSEKIKNNNDNNNKDDGDDEFLFINVKEYISYEDAAKMKQDIQARKIFVKNIPKWTRLESIKQYFRRFGEVEAIQMQHSFFNGKKQFRGIAFVIMKKEEDVLNVLLQNTHFLQGQKIMVNKAYTRSKMKDLRVNNSYDNDEIINNPLNYQREQHVGFNNNPLNYQREDPMFINYHPLNYQREDQMFINYHPLNYIEQGQETFINNPLNYQREDQNDKKHSKIFNQLNKEDNYVFLKTSKRISEIFHQQNNNIVFKLQDDKFGRFSYLKLIRFNSKPEYLRSLNIINRSCFIKEIHGFNLDFYIKKHLNLFMKNFGKRANNFFIIFGE